MPDVKQLAGPQSRRRFLAVGGGSPALAAFLDREPAKLTRITRTATYGGYFNFLKDGVQVAGGMRNDGESGTPDCWSVYLATDVHLDESLNDALVPPLLVQALVENAVRFVMEELSETDRSTAFIQTDGGDIYIEDIQKMYAASSPPSREDSGD